MPDKVMKPAGGTVMRVTQTDPDCGTVGDCYGVSRCVATVEITHEYIDSTDLTPIGMDGKACWVFETLPELKWERYKITVNSLDIRIWNLLTGAPLYLNEATPTPEVVGWDTTRDMIESASAGIELWLRQAGEACAPGLTPYGYWVSPWIVGGKLGDISVGNAVVNFVMEEARSGVPSPWGVGPYNVERNAVTQVPRPMLTPINVAVPGQETIARRLITTLAPPIPTSGCADVTPELIVLPLLGAAAVARTATFPLRPDTGTPMLPGRINWGDATPVQVVTAGVSANHTYAAPGSYTATYTPTANSSPNYVSVPITVS
jgi:hypothetical protein